MRACHRHSCSPISASSFFKHHRRHFCPERCQAVRAWCASLGSMQVEYLLILWADSRDNHNCNTSVLLRVTSSTTVVQHLGASATCEQSAKHVVLADVPALERFRPDMWAAANPNMSSLLGCLLQVILSRVSMESNRQAVPTWISTSCI